MNKGTDIIIFGAGGFAQEVLWTITDINRERRTWNVVGFLDDRPEQWGRDYMGYRIMDPAEQFPPGCFAAHGVADGLLKQRITHEFTRRGICFATLAHPSVIIGTGARIGPGVVIQAGSIIAPRCVIRGHATINLSCTIGHDTEVGEYATVSPGAHISGNCRIGMGSMIGTGAAIREKIRIGSEAVIGANAAVVKDIHPGVVAVGAPAQEIRRNVSGIEYREQAFRIEQSEYVTC
jgi:sugar O-acyltransferase (sialic acid O-acetyltransferase NeuD family)